jgi:hypothetical protein
LLLVLYGRSALLRDGLRRKELFFCPSTQHLPFSAQTRFGPCWANFATRLTALSVGAMGWNARADSFLKRDGLALFLFSSWRSIKSKQKTWSSCD